MHSVKQILHQLQRLSLTKMNMKYNVCTVVYQKCVAPKDCLSMYKIHASFKGIYVFT